METAPRAAGAVPSRRRLGGQQRVWLLVLALLAADVALFVLTDNLYDAGPLQPWWWLLAPVFGASEVFVIHLHFRRNAYSFALSEVPLVLGLFFLSPTQLLATQMLGVGAALVLHRRQSLHKLAFNLTQLAFMTLLAVLVFNTVVPAEPTFGPRLWLAALLAVMLGTASTVVMIFLAMSLSEGAAQLGGIAQALGFAGLLSLANSSLGLIAIALISETPLAGGLLLVPVGVLYGAYKAYLTERDNHERLDFLYRTTQAVAAAPEVETAVSGLLAQIRLMFRADVAELTLFPGSVAEPALRTRLGPGEAQELMTPVPVEQAVGVDIPETVFLPAPADPARLAQHFEGRARKDAMAVALMSDGRVLGRLVVADRYGDIATFDQADLQLFRTLATQASMALENGRLEKSLDQLSRLKERLRHDASHDALTGLANRALLVSRTNEALADPDSAPGAVLMLDLDDFKTVNDSLGHSAGDTLLVEVAERIGTCVGEHGLAARLGGDEFAVLLTGSGGALQGVEVAERILTALQRPVMLAGREAMVYASIGIAETAGAADSSVVLRNADTAMYRAKQEGKNRLALFEDSMHSEAVRRLSLRGALQRALERDEFVLYYQPLVDLATGRVRDAEALLRWNHPEHGMTSPEEFIALAEETGVIVPIGRWVLQTAARQLALWQRSLPGAEALHVSVNLSTRQVTAPGLLEDVARTLGGTGMRPESLVLEITESVLMDDSDAALRTLSGLKALGVGLALDDFGTGYSSLSYLRAFPIDVLKLSKPFVDDLGSEGGRALVTAIAGLASALRMRTVAEGIETPEQAHLLREAGYDVGQGYHFARPLPAEVFARLVAEQPFLRVQPGQVPEQPRMATVR